MSDIDTIARQFIEALPHSHALGMRLESISEGSATISMPYDTRLIGDPATGVIHGGAVSALMDTACGAAVMSHPQAGVFHGNAGLAHRLHAPRDCLGRPSAPGRNATM